MIRLFDIWCNTETNEYAVREAVFDTANDDDAPDGFNKHVQRVRAESKRLALNSFLKNLKDKGLDTHV